MAHQSDPRFLVLHASKLKGFAETPAIAAVVGLKPKVVDAHLAELASNGHVMRRDGRIAGWMLTPAGRAEHGAMLAADVDAMGTRTDLDACYRDFLHWNKELLAVCTAWQVKDLDRNIPNDHSDKAYDADVIVRLGGVHEGVTPINARLKVMAVRFDPYSARLKTALDKVKRGEGDWFAKPLIDSYHTVWMELHEDLLASLNIARASEH